jgi:ubiquitin-protein ligase
MCKATDSATDSVVVECIIHQPSQTMYHNQYYVHASYEFR